MIILPNTTDKLQLVTSAAGDIDAIVSYGDCDQASPPVVQPFGRQLTTVVTAATTDILAAPASGKTRTPEEITIRNVHSSVANDVTVIYNANATLYEIIKVTLSPGDTLEYIQGVGWLVVAGTLAALKNQSLADQTTSAGVDTYLTGSNITIPTKRPIGIGTLFHWRVTATKTNAGTTAWIVNVRFGTTGTIADTARCIFTSAVAQTNVVDTATFNLGVIVRGPISSGCIVAGGLEFQHRLAATGFSTQAADVYQHTPAAFDITTVTQVGVSIHPGASAIFTFQIVAADAANI